MISHFADRVTAAIKEKRTPLCVGLDPRWEQLPDEIRSRHGGGTLASMARSFEELCVRILDVVAPLVAVVKPQSAFFEACGPAGLVALQRILHRARRLGLITILDSKRNDIASTAEAYADAAFAGTLMEGSRRPVWEADALTVNPYLGRDAVEPFLISARRQQCGVFVLVRTSNPGAGQFQDLKCEGRPLYEHVGNAVAAWSNENRGNCGMGDVGAVCGATHPKELERLRSLLPNVLFLIPGYGAQGGSAGDTAPGFRPDGSGAIVNSSRGIIACFQPGEARWEAAVEAATRTANIALAKAARLA
ncbi:MAG TPA: orotidine-5'-phosphate decarboxylase [Gemmataceae bacterium]|nr:orotidine-5'-phosphate decarboxylase [Gemmataceae bacterium]